jgi:heterodisulfide reductase subunit C
MIRSDNNMDGNGKIRTKKKVTVDLQQEFPKEVLSDPRITHEMGILRCIQCGRCSASCPAASIYDDFSPRDMMRKLSMGSLDELLKSESIWRCGQCYTCHSRCPRNNSPGTIVLVLRELAIRKGYAADMAGKIYRMIGENIWHSGETISPSLVTPEFLEGFGERVKELWVKMPAIRNKLGYDVASSRTHPVTDRAMMEIRLLLEHTGYTRIVEPDKEDRN